MKGRKPVPRYCKDDGHYTKAQMASHEPYGRPGTPPKPEGLDEVAGGEWDRIVPLLQEDRLLTEKDLAVLWSYCRAWSCLLRTDAEYQSATDSDARAAAFFERKQWVMEVMRATQELGLTPLARVRVRPMKEEKGDPVEDFLRKGLKLKSESA